MIKAIDKASVHRICSGQVIVSLALAVKELVENSLDAGATCIEVRLKEYGSECIEVVDNGCGVEEKNFEGLGLKHCTSKIEDFSDLTELDTFGFRGEALSSLCALSDLTITSRHASSPIGHHLEFNHNGVLINNTPCARQVGTTVSLRGLFAPLPVRHKDFLQNLKREFGKMTTVLTSYSLIGLNVRFLCTNQNSSGKKITVLSTPGLSNVRDNIASIFGSKQLSSLKDLVPSEDLNEEVREEFKISENETTQSNYFQLEGFISTCDHGKGRSSTDRQFFYVNSRPCDMPKVSKVINGTYHVYNRHQYPFVFLNVKTKKDTIDINVTPDKRKILVHQERFLLATLKATLQNLFDSIVPSITSLNPMESGSIFNHFQRSNCSLLSPISEVSPSSKRPCGSPESNDSKVARLSDDFSSPKDVCKEVPILNTPTRNSFTEIKDKNNPVKCSSELNQSKSASTIDSNNPLESLLKFRRKATGTPELDKPKKKTPLNTSITKFLSHWESTTQCPESAEKATEEVDKEEEDKHKDLEMDATFTDETNIGTNTQEPVRCEQNEINDDVQSINFNESANEVQCTENMEVENEIVEVEDIEPCTKRTVTVDFCLKSLKETIASTQKSSQSKELYRNFRAKISPSENQAAEQELRRTLGKEQFKEMEVLGQFNLGFILAKLGSDIFIIDQHATDEKYNFEMLQRGTSFQTQKLVIKQHLELTAVNESIVIDNMDVFTKNGFEIEVDEQAEGGRRLRLTAVPMSKNWTFGKEDIEELIFMLSDSPGTMCRPSKVYQMFASRACRKSVMIGQALTPSDMKKLIMHMGEIDQPWNCPHGRPTIRHLFNLALLEDHSQE